MNDNLNKNDQHLDDSREEIDSEIVQDEEGLANKKASKQSKKTDESEEDDVVFDDEAEMGTAEVVKRLRTKLKTAVEEKQEYLNGWQRDKAEFINARKRDEEARMEFLKFAKQGIVEEILPVLDSFDMAMGNTANWESVSKEWRTGMEGIYNQLVGVLTKHDIKAYGAVGDAFDPNLHQSISMVTSDDKSKDHKVAEVLQKGYVLSGKVIRPAMVRVFEA